MDSHSSNSCDELWDGYINSDLVLLPMVLIEIYLKMDLIEIDLKMDLVPGFENFVGMNSVQVASVVFRVKMVFGYFN